MRRPPCGLLRLELDQLAADTALGIADLHAQLVFARGHARGVDRDAGVADARSQEELFDKFFDRVPKEMLFERELLKSRLWRSPAVWEMASEKI